jgi:dTDP-4-amino-4,6-dideoxygalactose transaminase
MQMHKIKYNNIPSTITDSFEDEGEHLYGSGYTKLLEKKLALYYNKEYALTFSSATQALFFVCVALEIKEKEIIASPFNWGGCLAPFLFFNNKISFVDFDFDNYCISSLIDEKILTKNCNVILSVDYCGNPANTKRLKKFCTDNNLLLISDSSQSFGAYFENRPAGYYADIIIVSFGPGKSVYGGEGGAVITSNTKLIEKLVLASQHPNRQKKMFGFNLLNQFGLNGRMNPFAAKNIILNWDEYINILIEKQNRYYNFYKQLVKTHIIKQKKFLNESSNSSFYMPLYELTSTIQRSEIELRSLINYSSITLAQHPMKLLTEDNYFLKEFRHLSKEYFSKNFLSNLRKKNFVTILEK